MRIEHFNKLNISATIGLTIIALLNKEITVFYMLYLFWWQALIEIFAKIYIASKTLKSLISGFLSLLPAFFIMFIYFVFIVILFGMVLSFSNKAVFSINFDVFIFRNIPFVANLLFSILFTILKLSQSQWKNQTSNFGAFSAKMIILHVSIILGALIHFGLLNLYPDNFEGSMIPYVLSAVPFLLIRSIVEWRSAD